MEDINENTTGLIGSIFKRVKSLKTPLQLIGFALSIILTIVLFNASLDIGILKFLIVFMPFFLIVVVFSNNILRRVEKGGKVIQTVLLIVVIIVFAVYGYIAYSIFKGDQDPLSDSNHSLLNSIGVQNKTIEIQKNNFKIQSGLDNHRVLSEFYYDILLGKRNPSNQLLVSNHTKKEMNQIAKEIVKLRQDNSDLVYGSNEISGLVSKLQETILTLDFSEHIVDLIYKTMAKKGDTYRIHQVIDTTNWEIENRLRWRLQGVVYSEIEKDLIQEIGRDILVKKLSDFDSKDIINIKSAFSRMQILSENATGKTSDELIELFLFELKKYLNENSLEKTFVELANNPLQQIAVYLALNETGLIDLGKFIVKYSDESNQNLVQNLMKTELNLFNLEDLRTLRAWINEKEGENPAKMVFTELLDGVEEKLNQSSVQQLLNSDSVAEYVANGISYSFEKNIQNQVVKDLFNDKSKIGLGLLKSDKSDAMLLFKDMEYFLNVDFLVFLPDEFKSVADLLFGEKLERNLCGFAIDLNEILEFYRVNESSILVSSL